MSDFPDYIYAFEAEMFEAGPVRVIADDIPGYDGKYIEYIRADLVPQWEDIGTSDDKLIGAFLMTSLGAVNVGTICGDVVYLFGNDKPVRKNVFAYWMPIPKVPE